MRWFSRKEGELDAFAEAIRPELSALRVPAPPAGLRDRILADRAAGARVILPDGHDSRRPFARRHFAAIGLIAAVLVFAISRGATDETRDASPSTLFSFFGGVAHAEQLPAGKPRLAPALPMRADRLRPGGLQYSHIWRDSAGGVARRSESTLSVALDSSAGSSAWRVVRVEQEVTGGQNVTKTETLTVARRDLRMITRAVHVRPYRRWNGINIQQRMIGDSVSGRMTLDDVKGMRPIAHKLPSAFGPYLSDAIAPIYLAAVPLSASWQGSATLLGWAVIPRDVLYPIEMRVTGEDHVQVPAGTFDCWKVSITHGGDTLDSWVRKSDGIAVRAVERMASTGSERVVTLVRQTGM